MPKKKGLNQGNSSKYVDGHEQTFGEKPTGVRGRYVWDKEQEKLVRAEEYTPPEGKLHVQEDIKPFKSPIDGTIINSRSDLRRHNKQHGVTDSRDYSKEHYEKKAKEIVQRRECSHPDDKKSRIESLIQATEGKVRW